MALALVLLVASGLMIRTFLAMRDVQPGFTAPHEIFTMRIAIPETVVKDPLQAAATHEQILRRIEAIPGVTSVGLASSMPMDGIDSHDPVWVEDKPGPEGQMPPLRRYKWVTPNFFATIGAPLVAGRDCHLGRPAHAEAGGCRQRVARARVSGAAPRRRSAAASATAPRTPGAKSSAWSRDVRDDGVTKPSVPTVYWPAVMKDFWDQPTPSSNAG